MEFAGNGDLSGYAKKHKGITEPLTCKWFFQASSGLSYLHEILKTSHRDIKLDNILLDSNFVAKVGTLLSLRLSTVNMILFFQKMTDFGFAKQCYDQQRQSVILSSTFW